MNTTRRLTPLAKLGVLAAAGWGLYLLWHKPARIHLEESDRAVETEVAVQVGKVSLATLRHYVTAYGTVEPEPAGSGKGAASARITSPLAAIVAEVNCSEGERVEKGQTLFTLDSRKLDAAIEQARLALTAAQQNYEQLEKSVKPESAPLWFYSKARQERDLARSELDQALAQRALLKITAPLSGTVIYLNVRPGEVTDPEAATALVELVDLNRLIVAANVPSSQLPEVKTGQSVELVPQQGNAYDTFGETDTGVPNTPPAALTGRVSFVEDRVDPKTGMGWADVSVPPEARLRPGQFVRVRIIIDERRDCLTVPTQSLVKNESGEWVISLVSGKRAVQHPVKVGFREGNMVQVHSLMLKPGDDVVTTGAYGLPEKTRIRLLNE